MVNSVRPSRPVFPSKRTAIWRRSGLRDASKVTDRAELHECRESQAVAVEGGRQTQNSRDKQEYGKVFHPGGSDATKVFLISLPQRFP